MSVLKIQALGGLVPRVSPFDYELRGTPAGETRARLSPTK